MSRKRKRKRKGTIKDGAAPAAAAAKETTARRSGGSGRKYWKTPTAWNKVCSHCDRAGSIAYRHEPRAYACAGCIEERGIVARPSQRWRDGGAATDPSVRVTYADPGTLLR